MPGISQEKRSFPDPEKFFDYAVQLGAQHVELKYEARLVEGFGVDLEMAKRLRKKAKAMEMTFSIHAPYEAGISLGHIDREIRADTKKIMLGALEFAEELNALYITVHGGFHDVKPDFELKETIGQPGRLFLRDRTPKSTFCDLKERTLEDLAWFFREANKRSVVPALENLHGFFYDRMKYPLLPSDFTECGEVFGDSFKVNFDTGHAHSTGIQIVEYIQELGPERIIGAHVHDNYALKDDHLPIFSGTIDFPVFFQSYKAEDWSFILTVEAKQYKYMVEGWHRLKKEMQG